MASSRTLLTSLFLGLLAPGCGGGDAPAPAPPAAGPAAPAAGPQGPPPPGGPQGPPPPGGPGGPGGIDPGPEDLASSWRDDLAVSVPGAGAAADCPDADGDGFPAAVLPDGAVCAGLSADRADCDDADPAVTPATERWVPPGPFLMGSASTQAGADEAPVHVVVLSGYCLDRDEVTVGEWAAWLRETGRAPAGADVRSLTADLQPEAGRADHPAEGVTWAEARDYCAARGRALPTEAQWEKAARGGCEGGDDPARCDPADLRPYPWGTAAPTCALANHQHTGSGRPQLCEGDTLLADAGRAGAGPYGHVHLAGNVWEHVADAWHPGVYTAQARQDPGGPASGDHHVLRGGGWNTFSTNMRAANRFSDLVMGSAAGFRCARPTAAPRPDDVAPLQTVTLSGTVSAASGALSGRALYVTAFDAADAAGGLKPGTSPAAEIRLDPSGAASQSFALPVPAGGTYLVSAALDGGTGGDKEDYVAASGSGGFGQAEGGPVEAAADVTGLTIVLRPPPPPAARGEPPPDSCPLTAAP